MGLNPISTTPASDRSFGDGFHSLYERFLIGFVILGLAYSLFILALSWRAPILDMHAFRQTQTALSAEWMSRGSPWVAYETPVVGYPWTIPFEFPFYQWVVVLVHGLGLGLDQAGRLTSWLFYILSLPLAGLVIRRLGGGRQAVLIFWILWLFSPLYAFWSRAFLIESCANFLALAFLVGLAAYLRRAADGPILRRLAAPLMLMTIGAILAALVKITTFFGFALAGGGMTLWAMLGAWRKDRSPRSVLMLATPPGLAVLASLAFTHLWVGFADTLKLASPIGSHFTSASLQDWNFSSTRILEVETWRSVILFRAVYDTFWSPFPLLGALFAAVFLPKSRPYVAVGLALYLAPFLVFTNLHRVHNYYQYANALFAIFAAAGAFWALGTMDADRPWLSRVNGQRLAVFLLLMSVGTDVLGFYRLFWPSMRPTAGTMRTLTLADYVKATVPKGDVVFAFGDDWSSDLAYYSARRFVAFPAWIAPEVARMSPTNLRVWTGARRLSAVVDCPRSDYAPMRPWIARVEAGKSAQSVAGCTIYR